MLLADWDTKDRRDVARGSNTAIFEHRVGRWRREARYLITDWGGSMGRWGGNVVTRGRWDPQGFAAQTPEFVTGSDDDAVRFGYSGQRTADVAAGISIGDVRWLCRYLGRITDAQLRDALKASGATAGGWRALFTAAHLAIGSISLSAWPNRRASRRGPKSRPRCDEFFDRGSQSG